MKAYKIELLIIDFDQVGAAGIAEIIENQKFPNRCINPKVMNTTEADIGPWDDDHPLNNSMTEQQEYERLFPEP